MQTVPHRQTAPPSSLRQTSTFSPSSSQTLGGDTTRSLPKFAAFKSTKEKERSSFKLSKVARDVKITIAVMEDANKIKCGDSLTLKVPETSCVEEILNAAVEKHIAFNKCFNAKLKYLLVFKDGTEVKMIPGTDPPEPFTLCRYKEVSGYGYSQI